MNEPTAELLIRSARACDAYFTASEAVMAADEGVDIPGNASTPCWDASSKLRDVAERFLRLADQQMFQAKRMDEAQRRENRTGVEHRLGPAA